MKLEQSNSPVDASCEYNMSLCLWNIVPFFKSYICMGQVSGLQAFMESLSLKSGSHQNSTAAQGLSKPPLSACARTLFGQGRLEILNALSRVTQGDRVIQTWPILSHMNSARMCLCVCVFLDEAVWVWRNRQHPHAEQRAWRTIKLGERRKHSVRRPRDWTTLSFVMVPANK